MRGMLEAILNAIEDARKVEGKYIHIDNLKYTIRYMDGICYLLIGNDEVLGSVDGSRYSSTIAKSFSVIIEDDT